MVLRHCPRKESAAHLISLMEHHAIFRFSVLGSIKNTLDSKVEVC